MCLCSETIQRSGEMCLNCQDEYAKLMEEQELIEAERAQTAPDPELEEFVYVRRRAA